jgi:L-histidine N-alpha-methyltransferase
MCAVAAHIHQRFDQRGIIGHWAVAHLSATLIRQVCHPRPGLAGQFGKTAWRCYIARMSPNPERTPLFIQLHQDQHDLVRQELCEGLLAPAARISPKYLYDALGSRLFAAITELPEYYPSRTEAAIFAAHASEMAACAPAHATLVDLGAGNCEKAAGLFEALRPSRYVAVDISVDFLRGTLQQLQRRYPALDMLGVGLDFSSALTLPPQTGDGPRLLFYPGSSIGNFTPAEALRFASQARAACQGGGLLIGIDLVKPLDVLEPAYDDALGVTAAFNRNMLLYVNRLIGSNFALADWTHRAFFNTAQSRIEMHLEARRALTVDWPGGQRRFEAGERIHTENSYKYRVPDFDALLRQAGFTQTRVWQDAQGWFAVFWAQG